MNIELYDENNESKRDAFNKVTRETRATAREVGLGSLIPKTKLSKTADEQIAKIENKIETIASKQIRSSKTIAKNQEKISNLKTEKAVVKSIKDGSNTPSSVVSKTTGNKVNDEKRERNKAKPTTTPKR